MSDPQPISDPGLASSASNRKRDPRRAVATWRGSDLLNGQAIESLTVILRTRGCRWRGCTMCGYASEGAEATAEDLIFQFQEATRHLTPEVRVVKLYTSGSFLDPLEVPAPARRSILSFLAAVPRVERLVFESRPEYVTREAVEECVSSIDTEIGIGLESSSDLVREHLIQKGFSLDDFIGAANLIHSCGGRVKAYLLQKPIGLSEGEAIRDAVASARVASDYADIISLNLCNVQRGTPLERLWERGEYRPPWLWSAQQVLIDYGSRSGPPLICDPVGAGTKRGPHNCGKCDSALAQAIRRHSLEQDLSAFDALSCDCVPAWQKVLDLEERSFGAPLL